MTPGSTLILESQIWIRANHSQDFSSRPRSCGRPLAEEGLPLGTGIPSASWPWQAAGFHLPPGLGSSLLPECMIPDSGWSLPLQRGLPGRSPSSAHTGESQHLYTRQVSRTFWLSPTVTEISLQLPGTQTLGLPGLSFLMELMF